VKSPVFSPNGSNDWRVRATARHPYNYKSRLQLDVPLQIQGSYEKKMPGMRRLSLSAAAINLLEQAGSVTVLKELRVAGGSERQVRVLVVK
jgi:hypothetical protein